MGRIFQSEEILLFLLGEYDQLILKCVSGDISFQEFLYKYGDSYMVYALDGHESDPEERCLLEAHEDRIAPHREIWERILADGVCSDEDARKEMYIRAGRFGSDEGMRRLREIGEKYFAP